MPAHDTYLLHVYRSRAVGGWQWAARLERLPGGESQSFNDPEALLAHLRTLLGAGDSTDPPADMLPGTDVPQANLTRHERAL